MTHGDPQQHRRSWAAHWLLLGALALIGVFFVPFEPQPGDSGWGGIGRGVNALVYWGSLGIFAVVSTLLRLRPAPRRPLDRRTYLVLLFISPVLLIGLASAYTVLQSTRAGRRADERAAEIRKTMSLQRWFRRASANQEPW